MSKRKTKYSSLWESTCNWIQPCPKDEFSACCKICENIFSISGGGVSQVKSHATSKLHVARSKNSEGQSTLCKYSDNVIWISRSEIQFSPEEEIQKAVVLQAMKCVESNYSFASLNGDGRRFGEMFPHSKIAKGYKQNEKMLNTLFNMVFSHILKNYYWKI